MPSPTHPAQAHAERVADLARALAVELGWPADHADSLHAAARLHDSGLAEEIWTKSWPLTHAEWEVVHEHPDRGAALAEVALGAQEALWVRHHHERIDGGGYPHGLSGEAIPEGARIIALAEAFDAMSARLGADPDGVLEVLAECRACAGTQFWPPAVEALERLVGATGPPADPAPAAPRAGWSPPAGAF
ncbi:MAG: HD domain-containing protein [Thermoleophilia bacterium]|jgi:HD-GYP domain-containing protein (c-di-GMP phosphodiesterase class II)|nr:HD domain-containing protein [Thermoleophilia bacterium]